MPLLAEAWLLPVTKFCSIRKYPRMAVLKKLRKLMEHLFKILWARIRSDPRRCLPCIELFWGWQQWLLKLLYIRIKSCRANVPYFLPDPRRKQRSPVTDLNKHLQPADSGQGHKSKHGLKTHIDHALKKLPINNLPFSLFFNQTKHTSPHVFLNLSNRVSLTLQMKDTGLSRLGTWLKTTCSNRCTPL